MSCREHYIIKCLTDEVGEGKLTEWEEKFLESVERHLKEKGKLTDKQKTVLEGIWSKS